MILQIICGILAAFLIMMTCICLGYKQKLSRLKKDLHEQISKNTDLKLENYHLTLNKRYLELEVEKRIPMNFLRIE